MRIAYNEKLLPVEDGSQEVVASGQRFSKFGARVHLGVDWAVQAVFGPLEGGGEIGEAGTAHGEQVDIALGVLIAARNRTENKGHVDLVAMRFEDISKEVDQAHRFDDEASELGQERARRWSRSFWPPTRLPVRAAKARRPW